MTPIRLFLITSEYPTAENPRAVPFLVRQVEILRQNGVDVTVFHFQGRKNPLNYLRAWLRAHSVLRKQPYDLIHAHWGQASLPVWGSRLPLMVTFHGSDLQGIVASGGSYSLLSRVLRWVSLRAWRRADEVIVVSRHLVKGLPERAYHVIPIGINLALFAPRNKMEARLALNLPMDKKLVLFAANPSRPEKRFELAQQVVELLKDSMEIELIATGAAPYEQMPLYMSACDALLLTSAHEGSPTVVKEALASGLPVVSTNVGDVRERLVGVPGCVVVSSADPAALANGLRTALAQPGERRASPQAAGLDETALTMQVIDLYRALLERTAKKARTDSNSKNIIKKP